MCHVWTYWLMKNMFFQARASVESLKAWKLSHLPLLTALNSELTVQRENLFYHLGEEWKGLVVWKLPPSTGKRSSPSTVFQMLSTFVMVCLRVWPICSYIACLNLFVCLVYSLLLRQPCDCSLFESQNLQVCSPSSKWSWSSAVDALKMKNQNLLLCCAAFYKLWPFKEPSSTRSFSSVRARTNIMFNRAAALSSIHTLLFRIICQFHDIFSRFFFFSACSRSSAAEVHAEATGDPPFSVCDLDRAAGWKSGAGLAVFGEEQWGKVHTVAGLQQTAPGAQDAACTPSRYSVTQSRCRLRLLIVEAQGEDLTSAFFFCSSDVSIGERKLSSIVGELIWEEISQCIINECLLHSIPDNSSQLDEYSAVRVKQQFFVLCFCFFITFLIGLIFLCSRWSERPNNLRHLWRTWSFCREIPPTYSNTPETSTVISPPRSAKMWLWQPVSSWHLRCTSL